MERFLKFKENIELQDLRNSQTDNRVIVLRRSQLTDTIQVSVPKGMSSKQIKLAFGNLQVEKVYDEFPYPLDGTSYTKFLSIPLLKMVQLFSL